jgi:hypothetical protein
MRRLGLIVACALALLGAGCGGASHESSTTAQPKGGGATELRDIGQLRAAFNARSGVPRLIVLASPT